jgi:hypothetical protein
VRAVDAHAIRASSSFISGRLEKCGTKNKADRRVVFLNAGREARQVKTPLRNVQSLDFSG